MYNQTINKLHCIIACPFPTYLLEMDELEIVITRTVEILRLINQAQNGSYYNYFYFYIYYKVVIAFFNKKWG